MITATKPIQHMIGKNPLNPRPTVYPKQSNSSTTILALPEISIPQNKSDIQVNCRVKAIGVHCFQTESADYILPDQTNNWSPIQTVIQAWSRHIQTSILCPLS